MADRREHILVFPYPAQGHMIPILDFTHRLAVAGASSLSITILVTTKNLTSLGSILAAHPTVVSPLVLPFPPHPLIPAGVENTSELPSTRFSYFIQALADIRDPLRSWFLAHPSPPTSIVTDTFLGWTQQFAAEIGVRRYAFCSTGAFFFATTHHLWREMPARKDDADDGEAVKIEKIPSSPVFPWRHLSAVYRSYVAGDPLSELIKDFFRANSCCHGLIINTFADLEESYLGHLKEELGHNRVWAVGPVMRMDEQNERGGPSSVPPTEIFCWLDSCPDRTVVYICFGSQHVLSDRQLEILTAAIENSTARFVLVTKGRADDLRLRRLEDCTAGRGVVIRGWAPQVAILRHRAVRAFMTHCGWNSTIESIAAGVPMLCMPMYADQFVNAALLVDQLDVAVRVCDGVEDERDPVALSRLLRDATSEKWADRRARTAALSASAVAAVNEGGSSFSDLVGFLTDLSAGKEYNV